MKNKRKGLSARMTVLAAIMIFAVILTVNLLVNYFPKIKDVLLLRLRGLWSVAPYEGGCARDCDSAKNIGPPLYVDLDDPSKSLIFIEVCDNREFESVGMEYFEFSVETAGEVSVLFAPGVYGPLGSGDDYRCDLSMDCYCYTPSFEIYEGEEGKCRQKYIGLSERYYNGCNPATLNFYSEKGKKYYIVATGLFGEGDEPVQDAPRDGTIYVSLTTCESCVRGGIRMWCKQKNGEGKCLDKCTIHNCGGGVCIPSIEHCAGEPTCENELSFSDGIPLSADYLEDDSLIQGGSSLVVYEGKLFVFYEQQRPGTNKADIWYKWTEDGETWEGPEKVPLKFYKGKTYTSPSATVFDGEIYLSYVFTPFNPILQYPEIYVAKTSSGQWDIDVEGKRITKSTEYSESSPHLAVVDNQLYVFFFRTQNKKIFYKLTSNGEEWEPNKAEKLTNVKSAYPSAESPAPSTLLLGYSSWRNDEWEVDVREYNNFPSDKEDYEIWYVTADRKLEGNLDLLLLGETTFAFYHGGVVHETVKTTDYSSIFYNSQDPLSKCEIETDIDTDIEAFPSVATFDSKIYLTYAKHYKDKNDLDLYYRTAPIP